MSSLPKTIDSRSDSLSKLHIANIEKIENIIPFSAKT